MPQIPQYGGPQVRQQPLPGGATSAPDLTSSARAVAGGLAQVSEGLDRIVDRDATAEADAADAEITSGWLRWNAENRQKYRGANADGYVAAAEDWWKKTSEAYGGKLSTLAKAKVSSNLVRKQGAALGDVVQFVGQEKERHADDSALASMKETVELGVTTGSTGAAALRVREIAEGVGARKGWTPEQKAALVRDQLDDMHAARAISIARTNAEGARQYLAEAEARGELTGTKRAQLKDHMDKAASEQEGLTLSRKTAGLTFEERLKKAAEITDPVARKAAEHDIISTETIFRQANADKAKKMGGQIMFAYTQSKRRPSAADLESLAKIDPTEAARIADAIDKDIRARLREAQDKPIKTDIGAYLHARAYIIANEGKVDPQQLLRLRDKVSAADIKQLGELSEKLQKDPKEVSAMFTEEATIRSFIPRTLGEKTEAYQKLQVQMQRALIDAKENKERVKGKGARLTDKEMHEALAPVFETFAVPGTIYGQNAVPAWQLTPEQRKLASTAGTPLANIPVNARAEIREGLIREGRLNPTEAEIAEKWARIQSGALPGAEKYAPPPEPVKEVNIPVPPPMATPYAGPFEFTPTPSGSR